MYDVQEGQKIQHVQRLAQAEVNELKAHKTLTHLTTNMADQSSMA